MELLRSNLSHVRIPEPTNRIYKHECCVSFDTPESEGGLYVDMLSFLGFGKEYVSWNYEKTKHPVYLHIKRTRKTVSEDRPAKKPTLLAIGVDGGFDNNEPEFEESYQIVIMPDHITLPFPSVQLPEKVRLAVDGILLADGAERKEQIAAWTAEKKVISDHALNLVQLDNGVVIPPTGWKCSKCDKTENLWLNLTDGAILCGRRNWDGSGGNDHAVNHYNETKYPLAVKLGTVTSDLETADVYSYPDDESIQDPLLAQHLAHFGIDFSSLQKTEMTTAELELDQNTNFDWNRIQESGADIDPLFGPGYTGLANLGNSCYMAATMQVLLSTRSFSSRYYVNQQLKEAFDIARADPAMDLNMQLTKLAHGMLSGRYSMPGQGGEAQEGIRPRMFKSVIAANHPEFSTMRQQDALEFFLHLIDQVEHAHAPDSTQNHLMDPAKSFKFVIEERMQCSSGKVAYNQRNDYFLSLNIPLHKATNKSELEAFEKLKAMRHAEGKEVSAEETVRPRIHLKDCLDCFSCPEEVHEYFSTALKSKTTAIKTAGLKSFPDYLVLHMRKFVLEAGWVPKKLDVYVDVPDTIDLSYMRSKGLQPGEELLPDADEEMFLDEPVILPDENLVSQLTSMGFNHLHCQKAAINTHNVGVEEAMNWLFAHMEDPDINAPIAAPAGHVDESILSDLISFGFSPEVARKALREAGNNLERASNWIMDHPEAATSSSNQVEAEVLPDGGGKYKLIGIISHIGTSTHCGHYVAHVYKDGRWSIFNDQKVGVSKNPPKDMGYLYFFERLED